MVFLSLLDLCSFWPRNGTVKTNKDGDGTFKSLPLLVVGIATLVKNLSCPFYCSSFDSSPHVCGIGILLGRSLRSSPKPYCRYPTKPNKNVTDVIGLDGIVFQQTHPAIRSRITVVCCRKRSSFTVSVHRRLKINKGFQRKFWMGSEIVVSS